MNRKMKGQAAMEFLMTYGWALLVIVVVIGALLFMNPFRTVETCLPDSQVGFSCGYQPRINSNNGTMVFTLRNEGGQTITVRELYAYYGGADTVQTGTITTPQSIPSGSSHDFSSVRIFDSAGNPGNQNTFTSGQPFSGKIKVVYSIQGQPDAYGNSTMTFTVSGTVS